LKAFVAMVPAFVGLCLNFSGTLVVPLRRPASQIIAIGYYVLLFIAEAPQDSKFVSVGSVNLYFFYKKNFFFSDNKERFPKGKFESEAFKSGTNK
jgi:hypothetical protein